MSLKEQTFLICIYTKKVKHVAGDITTCKNIIRGLGEKFAKDEVVTGGQEKESSGCNLHPDGGNGVAQILRLSGKDITCSATSLDKKRKRVCACKGGERFMVLGIKI